MEIRTEFTQDQIYAYNTYKMRASVEKPGEPLKTLQEYVEWLEAMQAMIEEQRKQARQ